MGIFFKASQVILIFNHDRELLGGSFFRVVLKLEPGGLILTQLAGSYPYSFYMFGVWPEILHF